MSVAFVVQDRWSGETPVIAPDSSKQIGTFTVDSGRLVVSDPSYDTKGKNSEIQGLMKAKNGLWYVALHESLNPVLYGSEPTSSGPVLLEARHESQLDRLGQLRLQPKSIYVDTGMVGFFDGGAFKSKHPAQQAAWWHPGLAILVDCDPASPSALTEDEVSACSLDIPQPCILPYGIISSTNGGDGLFSYYVRRDEEGQAVAVVCSLVSGAMVMIEGECY